MAAEIARIIYVSNEREKNAGNLGYARSPKGHSGSGGFAGMREAGAVTASGAYCRCAKVLDQADSLECAKLAP